MGSRRGHRSYSSVAMIRQLVRALGGAQVVPTWALHPGTANAKGAHVLAHTLVFDRGRLTVAAPVFTETIGICTYIYTYI